MDTADHSSLRGSAQLHQFLLWTTIATFLTTIIYIAVGMTILMEQMMIMAAGAAVLFIILLLAIWLNHRAQTTRAVYLTCSTIALYAVLAALVFPDALPVLALAPVFISAIALPYLNQNMLRIMSAGTLILAITVTALGRYVQIFKPISADAIDPLIILFVTAITFIILLLFWQNDVRLRTALQQSQQANRTLQALQAGLEERVAERTRDLQHALNELEARAAEQTRMREALEQQREVILGLSVPVLPITDHMLVMPLVGALDQQRLQDAQQRALKTIEQSGAQALIIDITGVPVVDDQVAKGLTGIVQASHLLGSRTILVGIRPEVAQALVGAGVDLSGIRTFASLQDALDRMLRDGKARATTKPV